MIAKIVSIVLVVVAGGIGLVRVAFGTLSDSIWTPTPLVAGPWAALDLTPGTFRGVGDGYYGPIVLDVTVDSQGILEIAVVEHIDTPAFWGMASGGLFPLILGGNTTGVNVVSGATYTSYGIIAAVEDAMLQAGADLASLRAGGAAEAVPAAAVQVGPSALGPFSAGSFVGVGTGGFYGDIHVAVTFSGQSMTDIEVVFHEETPMFAQMAFSALIPGVLEAQNFNLDAVTGATYTSEAFLEAVQDAVRQATGGGVAVAALAPVAPPAPAAGAPAAPVVAGAFTPGTFTGSYQGYIGPVTVAVTFSATAIVSITVTSHTETPLFANMVWQNMIPAMMAAQSANVSVVTGATYTSIALRNAVSQAISQASL